MSQQPRKQPHCRSCGSPMKGHARRACASQSQSPSPSPSPSYGRATETRIKPIMPGAFDRTRPSEISLLSRIGPKLEDMPEPLFPAVPSREEAATWIITEPHPGDNTSNASTPSSAPRACRSRTRDSDIHVDRSFAQRSNFSLSGLASSLSSSFIARTPIADILNVSEAVPLATVFEIAAKYVPFIEDIAGRRAMAAAIVNREEHSGDSDKVWLALGHNKHAVDHVVANTASRKTEKHLVIGQPEASELVKEMRRGRTGCCCSFFQLLAAGAVGGLAMYHALSQI